MIVNKSEQDWLTKQHRLQKSQGLGLVRHSDDDRSVKASVLLVQTNLSSLLQLSSASYNQSHATARCEPSHQDASYLWLAVNQVYVVYT